MPLQKNIRRFAWPLRVHGLALVLCWSGPQIASPAEPQSELRQREQRQQQASEMTRQLVRMAFDAQLRQLEENGLASLPLHHEVQSMRQVLERLATTEMQEVARQLDEAQRVSPEQQQALIQQASESVRRTVQQMTNQRQKLLRRLQLAQLSERLREMVELQTQTHTSTQQLNAAAVPQRESRAVMTLEDQRNVKTLFVALLATLHDVATWEGPIGTTSADSLRLLRELEVNQHLVDADRTLLVGQFNEASDHQQRILRALQLVLKKLETLQGLKEQHQQEWDRTVQQLAESQKDLHQQTHAAALQDPAQLSKLVQDQSALTQQIQLAAGATPSKSAAASQLDRAEKAAAQAAVHMFEQNEQQARAKQATAMEALRQALQASQPSPEKSESSQASSSPNGHDQQARDPARNRWGLLIGEWARAAEALERAAAAQRDLATTAENASQAPQGKSAQTPLLPIAQILPTQLQLSRLTNTLSEALRDSAPEIADQLARAASRMQDGTQTLSRKLAPPSLAQQPSALSPASARKYAQWASAIQKELEQAARSLRGATGALAAQGPAPMSLPPESPLAAATTGQTPTADANANADQASLADMAHQLQQQLRDQQAARDQIVQLADQLRKLAATMSNSPAATNSAPGAAEASTTTGADGVGQPQPSLDQLQESQRQFAAAQSAIGQLAAEMAQQSELTNASLLAAMQLASDLPEETNSKPSTSSDTGQQDEASGDQGEGEKHQAQDGASAGGEPHAGAQGSASTGAAQQTASSEAGQQDEASGDQGEGEQHQAQDGASAGGEPHAGAQGSASTGAAQQIASSNNASSDGANQSKNGPGKQSKGGKPSSGDRGTASGAQPARKPKASSGSQGGNGKRTGTTSRGAPAAGTPGTALGRGSRALWVAPRKQPNPASNSTGPAPAGHMGTGLVPASPDVTAQRIAGRIPFAHPMSQGQQERQDREDASRANGEQEHASHHAGSHAGSRPHAGAGDHETADANAEHEGTSKGHDASGSKHAAQSKGTSHEGSADGQPHAGHETGATRQGPQAASGTERPHASHSGAGEERESLDGNPHSEQGHAGSVGREGGLGGGGGGGQSPRPLDKPRSLESEAWFAKLPPAVQRSARLRSTRAFPKSYETRLQRYFEAAEQ